MSHNLQTFVQWSHTEGCLTQARKDKEADQGEAKKRRRRRRKEEEERKEAGYRYSLVTAKRGFLFLTSVSLLVHGES